jgi:hypothetical protein
VRFEPWALNAEIVFSTTQYFSFVIMISGEMRLSIILKSILAVSYKL